MAHTKQHDKKWLLILIFLLINLSSCKQKSNVILESKTDVLVKAEDCNITTDLSKIKFFFDDLLNNCKDNVLQKRYFNLDVYNTYKDSFCSLIEQAILEQAGEIEYDIVKENNKCKGYISINSVSYYIEEGEKIRNEYSTFLTLSLFNNVIVIEEIGGAG